MYVHGVGAVVPDTVLSNVFLAELSPEYASLTIGELTGIESRYSVLAPQYLRETKNSDPWQAVKGSTATATDLSMQAAHRAIEHAGITPDKIGLVLAECATPYETIPTEAQRIANRLNIKVVAFDLLSSGAFFSLALSTLDAWKPERLPEYILLVSTSTPTQRVNYSRGVERLTLGDGAAAFVISPTHPAKVKVLAHAYTSRQPIRAHFDIFSHASLSPEYAVTTAAYEAEMLQQAQSALKTTDRETRWIPAHPSSSSVQQIAHKLGVREEHVWSCTSQRGDTLGCAPGFVLQERWRSLTDETSSLLRIVITQVGAGNGYFVIGN